MNEIKTETKQSQVTFIKLTTRYIVWFSPNNAMTSLNNWLHCLTPESIGRFLVNNILFHSAWCLVMAKIQFSLIKKIKIGSPEHSLPPHPQRPITFDFWLSPHPPQSEKRLRQRCFHVGFAKFLGTLFIKEHLPICTCAYRPLPKIYDGAFFQK